MNIVIIPNFIDFEFRKYALKNFYIHYLKSLIRKSESIFLQYLKDYYDISETDFFEGMKKSVSVAIFPKYSILYINKNCKIKNIKMDTILRISEFGNLNMKRSNIFENSKRFVSENIALLIKIFYARKDIEIWQ